MIKRGWVIIITIILLVALFFNLRFLGWAVSNTTISNVTIIPPNYPPEIADLNTSLYVCEDDKLSHYFTASDADGHALDSWIDPQNPFFVLWTDQFPPNTHQFVIISGTLDKGDAGGIDSGFKLYEETVYVDDDYNDTCCQDTEDVNITVIEINHVPSIEDIGVQTVWTSGENSTFYEEVDVSDEEYDGGHGNITFNISIVNSTGQQVDLFNISDAGIMNFTADNETPVGVYDIRICAEDTGLTSPHENISDVCSQTGGAMSACDDFSLTVTEQNRAPNITSYYPENLTISTPGTTSLYFNITKDDPDGTIPDAYWYLNDTLMETDSGSSVDEFSHTFGCGVSGYYTVKVEITDGELNDSLQWNITVSGVSCPSPVVSGGGGGGAGIILRNFEVNPKFITTTIFHKQGRSFDLNITNMGDEKAEMQLSIENLTDKAILNEKTFTLNKGESRIVNLYLYALSETKPGVYFGSVVVSNGFVEKQVKIVLEIKSREALFDFKITIPPEYKSVVAGDDMKAIVDILNVGLYGQAVDVELYLSIVDFDKLILYETSKEFIAVEKNISVERTLHVPATTFGGTYLVYGELEYGNLTLETYDTFNVFEKRYVRPTYIIIIIILIALILFILFLIYRRRKDRKERGYR